MLFSIITAVYNNKNEILGALNSVHSQKDVQIEHIVMDGGSTDGTTELIQQAGMDRVIFDSSKDKGIYDAINKGIQKASGDIIGILHSDDFFTNDLILKEIESYFLDGFDVVYGDLDYVYKENTSKIFRKWIANLWDPFQLRLGWMPPHPTIFLKKNVYEEIGNYDLDYKISADYDLILRVFINNKYKIAYLPKTLVKMRVGGASNRSLKNIIKKTQEDIEIASKYFYPASLTILFKNIRKLPQLISGRI